MIAFKKQGCFRRYKKETYKTNFHLKLFPALALLSLQPESLLNRLVFSWFFKIRGNLGNIKEKTTRKTCWNENLGFKETLKWGRICQKFLKQELEHKVVASLVASKILRSTEIKSEVTESKLSLLLKYNIMHVENHSREQLLRTYNHSAINVIKVSK